MSKIIQKLGYDVPEEEISLGLIATQNLDENELEVVAGGDDEFICNVRDNWIED